MAKFGALQFLLITFVILTYQLGFTEADKLDDDANDSQDPSVLILFMFFGLGLGIFVMQVISKFGEAIPYTVVVFILGVIFSTAATGEGAFAQSIAQWVSIDAELVLYIFLPPLIFGEAMNLNWYYLKGGLAQALLLAGPGVVFGTLVMGALTKLILPYDWAWSLAMTFGAILSANDPVAVVALLKGANASPKLTILKVGESLLNDGTAMVVFTVFFNSFKGRHYNAASVITYFFASGVSSVGLGIAFGLIAVRWLRSANRPLKEVDVTVQIAITLCCAYLVFFTAQYTFEMSGALACCSAGAMLAWLGPPIILSHETMHNVWGMIEWVLNTLIFLLAGLIIGHRVLGTVRNIDWLYCIVLYVVLMVLRFITIGLLYPWLSRIGHKCTVNEAIFISWAGLRGALSMTLALLVEKGGPPGQESETSRLFFYVGVISALTLIINATTSQQLLIWLGLLGGDSPEKTIVMAQIKKKLRRKMAKVIDQMASEFSFTSQDLNEVRNSCTLLKSPVVSEDHQRQERESEVDQLVRIASLSGLPIALDDSLDEIKDDRHRQGSKGGNSMKGKSQGKRSSYSLNFANSRSALSQYQAADISRRLNMSHRGPNATLMFDLLSHVRAIFLEIVKVRYWSYIEGGKLPRLSRSSQFLLYSIEVGLDQVKDFAGAKDWAAIEQEIDYNPWAIRILSSLEEYLPLWCPISHTLGQLEAVREKRAVYMLTSFIEAHQHAQGKIHAFIGYDEDDDDGLQSPEEIRVIAESVDAVHKAEMRLAAMSTETIGAIRSKQAARLVLAKEAEMVKNMMREGLITNHHAEEFFEEIGEDTARIEKERNQMYREQGKLRGERRLARKVEEHDMRRSLLSQESLVSSSVPSFDRMSSLV